MHTVAQEKAVQETAHPLSHLQGDVSLPELLPLRGVLRIRHLPCSPRPGQLLVVLPLRTLQNANHIRNSWAGRCRGSIQFKFDVSGDAELAGAPACGLNASYGSSCEHD